MDAEGIITCWGDDYYGQISQTPTTAFVSFSTGYYHTCAVDESNSIQCWGWDQFEQSSGRP
jgi:alpha-tubulin suppressor-like RCC1 family protein